MSIREAVIPAGGQLEGAFLEMAGTPWRALAPIGGIPCLQLAVNAVREAGIERIIAVADNDVRERISGVDVWRQASATGPANILIGLREVRGTDPVLLCPCDLPLLNGNHIRNFLDRCPADADIIAGVAGRKLYESVFADAPPSQFINLADLGPITNSSAFVVRPSTLLSSESLLGKAFESRKSQIRMALLLGPALVWKFAARTLTVADVQKRVEYVLRCQIGVVTDIAPELTYDIDSVNDYSYARSYFDNKYGNAAIRRP